MQRGAGSPIRTARPRAGCAAPGDFRAHDGRDFRRKEFDRTHHRFMRRRSDGHLHQIALMIEEAVLVENFLGHLVRVANHQPTAEIKA